MKNEQEIKQLFQGLQKQDQATHTLPDFDEMLPKNKPNYRPWLYAVAAVTLALIGVFSLMQDPVITEYSEDFNLSLDILETEESDPLLADNPDMFDWSASTDILIQDFDE